MRQQQQNANGFHIVEVEPQSALRPNPLSVSLLFSCFLAPTVSCFNILFIFHLILMRLFPTSLWSSSSLTLLAPNGYIEWAEVAVLCTLGTCKTCSVLFYFLFGFPSHNSPPSPPTWVRFLGQKMRRQEAAKWVAMNCYTRRASTRLDSTRLWLPAGVLCDLAYPALPWPGLAWLNKRRRTYKEQAVKWAAAATGNSYENSNNNNSHTHTHTSTSCTQRQL